MLLQRVTAVPGLLVVRLVDDFSKLTAKAKTGVVLGMIFFAYLLFASSSSHGAGGGQASLGGPQASAAQQNIKVLTWNLAAINNNPFEYWLTLSDEPKYGLLMNSVEKFIQSTKHVKDQSIGKLFPESYVDQLMEKLQQHVPSVTSEDVAVVRGMYVDDWSKRLMISGFLKDPAIGKKRLVSMPDRMTNTIQSTTAATLYRPTSINCYSGTFSSLGDWYGKWLDFMFDAKLEDGKTSPVQLLKRISRQKYPDLSEEEEQVSVPLQVLLLAVFDAIQIRVLNQVSIEKWRSVEDWQVLRHTICDKLNFKKNDRTVEILTKSYADADVLFLQEASEAFMTKAVSEFGAKFHVIANIEKPSSSDQNSMILLSKRYFTWFELDHAVSVPGGVVADGDLLVARAKDLMGRSYLLASFHGDTNGLATIPTLDAVVAHWNKRDRLVFGMDGNTYENPTLGPKYQNFEAFVQHFTLKHQLESCWGKNPTPEKHTTRNARTFMQPQLAKAASQNQIAELGDANPKDFILFSPKQYQGKLTGRDNTGKGTFVQNMVFPTLDFPSDHAIVRVVLEGAK